MPDRPPLDADRLRAALAGRWARVEIVAETPSTNADLLADRAAPDRSVLVAEHQLSGRGRFDRVWTSPPRAGLTFSLLLRPAVAPARWGWLPLLAGLALYEGVRAIADVPAVLKWPNDLLSAPDGGKLAGILTQTSGDAVVLGIGLNVSTTTAELPVDTATSLALCAADVDRTDLLEAVLTRMDAWLGQWAGAGGDAAACGLDAGYRSGCATLGRPVRVSLGDGTTLEGTALDFDEVGRLVVRTAAGDRMVSAGDVEHLRAA